MNPIAIRLLNQQLVVPQYSDPAEVVSYMGAMQAQEYRMMRAQGHRRDEGLDEQQQNQYS